jgi:RNA polymerase sigma-54 factor
MTQSLSQVMGQYMRMEQRLTPQLIQSMDILQLNMMALENRVAEELEKNVALEIVEPEPTPDETASKDDGRGPGRGTDAESFNRLDTYAREYDLDSMDGPYVPRRAAPTGERDPKLDAMANTASRPGGLNEYLLSQWRMMDVDDEIRRAGEAIIYHLEEDGYLKTRLEEIADSTRPAIPAPVLEDALKLVQQLDPPGIAARDYQECLLLQLDALPGDNRIERTLIRHHLHDIEKNRYPAIAKATGYSIGEIQEAVKAITSTLYLHPGYLVVDRQVPRIHPDVVVDYADRGGGLEVRASDGNSPRLRVSKKYIEMLRSKENGKEVRDFVRKHVESAHALIDAIRYRRSRLLDVARAIVERQRDFFEVGPQGLKVLRMSELAEKLGCDPSTISRTVAEKYMQTPRGIYPMRYFFTGGTETEDGQTASWDSVKVRVSEIIEKEDSNHPLNDDQIAATLKREGIEISRRTVAKYRQQLDIPPARQRRQF